MTNWVSVIDLEVKFDLDNFSMAPTGLGWRVAARARDPVLTFRGQAVLLKSSCLPPGTCFEVDLGGSWTSAPHQFAYAQDLCGT